MKLDRSSWLSALLLVACVAPPCYASGTEAIIAVIAIIGGVFCILWPLIIGAIVASAHWIESYRSRLRLYLITVIFPAVALLILTSSDPNYHWSSATLILLIPSLVAAFVFFCVEEYMRQNPVFRHRYVRNFAVTTLTCIVATLAIYYFIVMEASPKPRGGVRGTNVPQEAY